MYRKIDALPESFVLSLARRAADKPTMPSRHQDLITAYRDETLMWGKRIKEVIEKELGVAYTKPEKLSAYLKLTGRPMDKVKRQIVQLLAYVREIEDD